ncbi:DNA/RNA nuclease SfsA [Methanobacterium sp. MBAC-LM]|uniref:DNA/RNA nuclease SfsA n=1 Tax=Methanobacterium sp. MBAC-LM TaxID=3412034 RepID=UPI003C755C27
MENNTVLKYETPLIDGIIKKRKSQFTIDVVIDNEVVRCHCPTTGRIGNIDLSGIPCLLSKSNDPKRKTPYTVEAVSLDLPESKEKSWIGINQNAANRYVENALVKGLFQDMVSGYGAVLREQVLGISKLDFLVGDTYIEVKTPLLSIQLPCPKHIKTKKVEKFSSTERFIKHINELAASLTTNQRAILLVCFIYNNPGFKVEVRSINSDFVEKEVQKCISKGMEIWQVNFIISKDGVKLQKYFEITHDFMEKD